MATVAIPVSKAKASLDVDTDKLPEHVYQAIFMEGMKAFLGRGMSKITLKDLSGDQLAAAHAAALAQAQKNLEQMYAGTIRIVGQKAAGKVSGAIMTEARRLARNIVKDEMKKQGIKVSHVEASEITKAANSLLASHPELIEQAEANLKERSKVASGLQIDVKAIPVSQKLVAKAEADKAKKKKGTEVSAAQAGKPAKSKPKAQATA